MKAKKVLEDQGYLVEFFPFKGKKKEEEKSDKRARKITYL